MRIGIDLGGTKTEIIAIGANGQELLRERVPTPSQSYAQVISTIAQLVEKFEEKLGKTATVGIGIPGAISPATGLVKNANTTCLIGHAFDRDLSTRLGREVRLANDANCFALSEATDGAAAGAKVVFGVIMGTGTGGGISVNGRLIVGKNAIAGEWGHNPLPWPQVNELPGPICYCGKKGCIETYLSGPGVQRDHLANTGFDLSPPEIAERALAGDVECEATFSRLESRMARSLASIINVIDPDIIVLGGGLSNIDRLYLNVPKTLPQFVFSDEVATKIVKAKFGDSSGVRGAAWLW